MNHTGTNPQTKPNLSAVAIIPARFASTRLPGKLLLEIAGKPMILWVVQRALAAKRIGRVIVATDDERIAKAVRSAGYEALETRSDHESGTDRLAEVAATFPEAEVIVNVQGDEPLIATETIDLAVDTLLSNRDAGIATTWEAIESPADVLSPNVVKVVVTEDGRAIYFSRSPVPHPTDAVRRHGSVALALTNEPGLIGEFKKHTGLYVYRREVLLEFTKWPQTTLEKSERLEQLRALEHGVRIQVVQATLPSVGVDTPEDLERVRALMGS